ncbi:hypothetical protein O6R05_04535 [Peptoniphilus equinus]|uniref:Type IV pilus assembly protein PilM n=1 Tax=Peptoniphilus equinus TaxID=3016343 RepID=A0ABY7QR67_9FIRM|nr:hypothetical protein [Peptoniphilus equinus]WBW49282.1 hypothetical protein O6R05_04535 [Peptoniphilus equinus]
MDNFIVYDGAIHRVGHESLTLPLGLIEQGVIVEPMELTYLLKKTWGDEVKQGRLFLDSPQFIDYTIERDEVEDKDVASYVYYELKRLVPVDLEDYVYSFDADREIRALLLRRDIFEEFTKVFSQAGIELIGFYSLAHAVLEPYINVSAGHVDHSDGRLRAHTTPECVQYLKTQNLTVSDASRILNGQFVAADEDILKDVKGRLQIFQEGKWSFLRPLLHETTYILMGDMTEVMSLPGRPLQSSDLQCRLNLKPVATKKRSLLPLWILTFLVINLGIFFFLSAQRRAMESEPIPTYASETPQKVSPQELFEGYVKYFEGKASDGILIEEYRYQSRSMHLRGWAISSEVLQTILDQDSKITLVSTELRNNQLRFELEIRLDNETR